MKIIFTFLLVPAFMLAHGQEKKQNLPVVTLRINPLSFAEQAAGPMIGVGLQWNRHWSVAFDPMYIFYSPFGGDAVNDGFNGEHVKVRGYKLRVDLKYYVRGYQYAQRGWFVGVELHYKHVSGTHWDDFGMNCTNGQCDYIQRATYDEQKTEAGLIAKIGMVRRLWNPRWSYEFYCGVGLKSKTFAQKNQPAGGTFLYSPDHGSLFSGESVFPMLPGGIKFVYRIF